MRAVGSALRGVGDDCGCLRMTGELSYGWGRMYSVNGNRRREAGRENGWTIEVEVRWV